MVAILLYQSMYSYSCGAVWIHLSRVLIRAPGGRLRHIFDICNFQVVRDCYNCYGRLQGELGSTRGGTRTSWKYSY